MGLRNTPEMEPELEGVHGVYKTEDRQGRYVLYGGDRRWGQAQYRVPEMWRGRTWGGAQGLLVQGSEETHMGQRWHRGSLGMDLVGAAT